MDYLYRALKLIYTSDIFLMRVYVAYVGLSEPTPKIPLESCASLQFVCFFFFFHDLILSFFGNLHV